MKHTLTQLTKIVHDHNLRALDNLWKSKPWLFPGSPPDPTFATAPPLHTGPCASVSSSLSHAPKHIGKFNNKLPPFDVWTFVQDALICPATNQTEAVFSVIDDSNPNAKDPLDVVLCVGINYAQFLTPSGAPSHAGNTSLLAPTNMRASVGTAFKLAYQSPPNSCQLPDPFHLVAANFFPWITRVRWESLIRNSIGEAILMEKSGYDDPVGLIAALVNEIEPKWIVFHGTNNCVPILGMRVLKVPSKHKAVSIICDNLGHFPGCNSILFP